MHIVIPFDMIFFLISVARKRQGLQVQKIISFIVCVISPIVTILGIAILATQDGARYPIIGGSPIYVGVYVSTWYVFVKYICIKNNLR